MAGASPDPLSARCRVSPRNKHGAETGSRLLGEQGEACRCYSCAVPSCVMEVRVRALPLGAEVTGAHLAQVGEKVLPPQPLAPVASGRPWTWRQSGQEAWARPHHRSCPCLQGPGRPHASLGREQVLGRQWHLASHRPPPLASPTTGHLWSSERPCPLPSRESVLGGIGHCFGLHPFKTGPGTGAGPGLASAASWPGVDARVTMEQKGPLIKSPVPGRASGGRNCSPWTCFWQHHSKTAGGSVVPADGRSRRLRGEPS